MDGTFDIFKKTSDGTHWVEAVRGIEQAKKTLLRYQGLDRANKYLVFDAEQGQFIDILGEARSA